MEPGEATAHTVVTHDDAGQVHVQHYGPAHVVDGSVRVIEVPAGTVIVLRHVGVLAE